MDFNLKCENLKNNILKTINESQMPIATIYYIFKSIFVDVQNQYYKNINELILAQQNKEKERDKTEENN